MAFRSALVALACVSCLSGVALGQDPGQPQHEPPQQAPPNLASAIVAGADGMKMADTAATKLDFVDVEPASPLTSRLVGLGVYNNAGESIGEIEDFAISDGKAIQAVILGVGGFLGVAERHVAVSPASITLSKKDGTLRALVDTTKDALKAAPAFDYRKKS